MKNLKKILLFILVIISSFAFSMTSFAHSGRTDSSGGHHDYNNKSGLGSYHYHHGMGPHLHPDGICPYSSHVPTASSSINKPKPKPSIKVSGISTNMNVGDICGFDATIANTNNKNIKVISSNSNVISAKYGTTLYAKGAGTSTITIGNKTVSKSFTITVKEVYATNLKISTSKSKLQVGKTIKIKTKIIPLNTTNKKVAYKSSNRKVATVSKTGTIKGISPGEATITVTTSNNICKKLTIKVFEVVPKSIKSDDKIDLKIGSQYDFAVNILPKNAKNKDFDIICDDENIIQYKDGKITAAKVGTTYLHVETWNGVKKDIPVQVDIMPVENIEIIDSTNYVISNILDKSGEIILDTKITPDNATYQSVNWKSSDNSIVSVENGSFIT